MTWLVPDHETDPLADMVFNFVISLAEKLLRGANARKLEVVHVGSRCEEKRVVVEEDHEPVRVECLDASFVDDEADMLTLVVRFTVFFGHFRNTAVPAHRLCPQVRPRPWSVCLDLAVKQFLFPQIL